MNKFKEYLWISISTIQTIQPKKGPHILHLIYAWHMADLWAPKKKSPASIFYWAPHMFQENKGRVWEILLQNSSSVTEHGSVWTSQDSKPNWKDALPPKSPPKHATDVWEQHTTRYTHTHTALLKNGWCSHNFMITDRNKHPRAPNLSGSPSFLSASSRFWNSVWKISRCFSMSTCSHFLASSSCVLSWRYTWTLRCSSSRRASACGSELRSTVWTCVFLNKNNDKFNSQSCPT